MVECSVAFDPHVPVELVALEAVAAADIFLQIALLGILHALVVLAVVSALFVVSFPDRMSSHVDVVGRTTTHKETLVVEQESVSVTVRVRKVALLLAVRAVSEEGLLLGRLRALIVRVTDARLRLADLRSGTEFLRVTIIVRMTADRRLRRWKTVATRLI